MQYADLPDVRDLLATYRSTRSSDNTTYLVSPELRIVRTNAGWTRFALANGGEQMLVRWGHGASLLEAISPALRTFYRTGFERVFATGERWEHDYECSSAERYQQFRMIAFPIRTTFMVVTHALLVTHDHDRLARPPAEGFYARDGIIKMCSSCRRIEAPGHAQRWDWVPQFVAQMPPNTSHGLCPPCATFYE